MTDECNAFSKNHHMYSIITSKIWNILTTFYCDLMFEYDVFMYSTLHRIDR